MTEIKICDLYDTIASMSPIEIYINDKRVWSDDVDLTNVSIGDEAKAIHENISQYNAIFARQDLVEEIIFKITDYHHSVVYIKTEGNKE